jgi:invasion protein IalB
VFKRLEFGFVLLALSGIAPALGETAATPAHSSAAAPVQFGDWYLRCLALPNALPCDIVQSLQQKDTHAQVLAVSIAYSPKEGKQPIQISVPLGIDLRRGVDVVVGSVTAKHVHVSRCELSGCIIEAVLGEDVLSAMGTNDKAKLVVSSGEGADTTLEFSLKGFKDAEAALRKETVTRQKDSAPAP